MALKLATAGLCGMVLMALASGAHGQEISREAEQSASIGREAMQCAFLAAGSGGRYANEAARLAGFGYDHTLFAMLEFAAVLDGVEDSTSLGPLTPFLRERSAEFWAGTYFSNDATAINQLIDSLHPFSMNESYEATMAQRRLEAEREFERRDCSAIGR